MLSAGIHRQHDENRGASEWYGYGLRNDTYAVRLSGGDHLIALIVRGKSQKFVDQMPRSRAYHRP